MNVMTEQIIVTSMQFVTTHKEVLNVLAKPVSMATVLFVKVNENFITKLQKNSIFIFAHFEKKYYDKNICFTTTTTK